MATNQSTPHHLLLETYLLGLQTGIIKPATIIAWADEVIVAQEEPDYLFIELSLSRDRNKLIEVLNQHITPSDNAICIRVLLGCIFRKLTDDNDALTVEKATTLVESLQNYDALTDYETDRIYEFADYELYYFSDITQLRVELINFLLIYEPFTLSNYDKWEEINTGVIEELNKEQIQQDYINKTFTEQRKKNERKKKLKRYLAITMITLPMVAILFWLIAYTNVFRNTYITFPVIVVYFLIRAGIQLWDSKNGQSI